MIPTADISFVRLVSHALSPARALPGDAGFDLSAIEDVTLAPGHRASVGTGIAIHLPEGTAGLILPRSGLAARHGISVVNAPGLIDSGYRGEVRVLLINHGVEVVTLQGGDRIAQLLVIRVPTVKFTEVARLEDSARGSGGFGSTGS